MKAKMQNMNSELNTEHCIYLQNEVKLFAPTRQ